MHSLFPVHGTYLGHLIFLDLSPPPPPDWDIVIHADFLLFILSSSVLVCTTGVLTKQSSFETPQSLI